MIEATNHKFVSHTNNTDLLKEPQHHATNGKCKMMTLKTKISINLKDWMTLQNALCCAITLLKESLSL